MLETKGTGYLTDETGSKVTGVRAIGSDGTEYTINAGAVIIATGGFAANKNMMERYVTEPTGVATSWPIFGYTINDGAMIEAAIDDLNAGVYNIDMVPVSHYNSIASIMKDYPVTIISDKLDSRWNYPRTKSLNDVPMSFAIEPDGLWISAYGKRSRVPCFLETRCKLLVPLGAGYHRHFPRERLSDRHQHPRVRTGRI